MWESWTFRFHAHLLCWLANRRDAKLIKWYVDFLSRQLDRIPESPYPLLKKWSESEHWILRFFAGRECNRCYLGQPKETSELIYQLARDPQFRVREGAAWGGVSILRNDFAGAWNWLSAWASDSSAEVRQTLAMILLPFIHGRQIPPMAEQIVKDLQTDTHKIVRIITKRWEIAELEQEKGGDKRGGGSFVAAREKG
jgi:hypothetical protein